MFSTVDYNIEARIAVVRMNRPDALNALSLQLTTELSDAINRALSDGARAILLTGNGRAFCSGGDLREMAAMSAGRGDAGAFLKAELTALHGLIRLIREAPVPFVAAVNGVCAGAGTNIALACDIVFVSDAAAFNEAFVKIGLSPDCGGTYFLPRAVGEKLAAELMMTGMTVSAQQALEMKMINRICPPDELLGQARALAAELAAGPTAAFARIKKMLNASFSNDLRQQLDLEARFQAESASSPDFEEGLRAFFEKRQPNFSGC